MFLVKSCEKKFNVKNGTICLGTLYGYREAENLEILDQEEGMLTFRLNFNGRVRIETKWFNTINNGVQFEGIPPVRFPGRTHTHFETLRVEQSLGPQMVLLESRGIIKRESLNSFVFCMSSVTQVSDSCSIFNGYDDFWYFHEHKVHDFANRLTKLLLEHIRAEYALGNYIVPIETSMADFYVHCEYGLVNYLPRDIELFDGDFMKMDDFMDAMRSMAFIKPERFQPESEYRFSFVLSSGGKVVEPLVKSLVLGSMALVDLVS